MSSDVQNAPEAKLTRRERIGLVIWTLGLLIGIWLFLVAAGAAFLYWKESMPHYEAGALAELMALHTVEGNYLADHKTYSASFLELDLPMGAFANANKLTFNEGYVFEFSNIVRDASGKITDYSIIARPVSYKRGTKRSYLLNSNGDIYSTDEHRPATIHDRKSRVAQ